MNQLPIIFLIFTSLMYSSFTLYSQEEMTLEKAIALGLENNFRIKVAKENIKIASNNNTWATTGKSPTVDLNGSFSSGLNYTTNSFINPDGVAYSGRIGGSLDAQWIPFNGGRYEITKDILEKRVSQAELQETTEANNLFRAITQQYYAVLFQKERREVLKDVLKLSRDRLAYERIKKEFGTSNSYNILQFETAVLTDSTNLVSQKVQIEIAKRTLYNTLDITGDQDFTFPDRLSVEPEQLNEEKLAELLGEESFTLKSLLVLDELSRLNAALESRNRKPVVALGASVGVAESAFKLFKENPQTGNPSDMIFQTNLNLGVSANFNWRVFDGGLALQQQESARLQTEVSNLNLLEAQAELNNQLDILVTNYTLQQEVLQLTDQQINLARRNLEMTMEQFKAGRITSLDYRNVQIQFLNAAFSKVNAIYNLLVTKTEIDWLVGVF